MSETGRVRGGLGEMVIVVISILIAFAVDAGWDRYQEEQEERLILAELQRDFRSSLTTLEDRWIPIHEGALSASQELLWRLRQGDRPYPATRPDSMDVEAFREYVLGALSDGRFGDRPQPVIVRDSLLGAALSTATYDPTLPSLDALLQSGSLARLQNRELRTALAEFPAELADLADEERLARDHAYTILRPALHRAANTIVAELVGYTWLEATEPLMATMTRRETEVMATEELANILATRILTQDGVVSEIVGLRDSIEGILELLEGELGEGDPNS
jgi:hypothetical protein